METQKEETATQNVLVSDGIVAIDVTRKPLVGCPFRGLSLDGEKAIFSGSWQVAF